MLAWAEREDWIAAQTQRAICSFVPEITLHLASELEPIWRATEDALVRIGVDPPFWAFAWPGGQALARYLLDDGAFLADARVLDLACGSGIAGIAAALRGAAVTVSDIDPLALVAATMNARVNGVTVTVESGDLLDRDGQWDVVLAGDLFYEKAMAARVFAWLSRRASSGAHVLIGDPGRTYLPDGLRSLRTYIIPTSKELEDRDFRETQVWTIAENNDPKTLRKVGTT